MPVDRAARDRMAEDVAQYMRGEIHAFAFDERLEAYEPSPDNAIGVLRHLLWFFYDDVTDHPVSLSEEEWNEFKRILAFLRTDLSLGPRPEDKRERRLSWYVCGFFVGIQGIATEVSLWQGGWGIAQTSWILLGCLWGAFSYGPLLYLSLAAVFVAIAGTRFQPPWTEYLAWSLLVLAGIGFGVAWLKSFRSSPQVEPPDYSPFRDEAQWKRYEPLVESFNLPTHTPGVHDQPHRSRARSALMTLTFAPMLILIWPLFVLHLLSTISTFSSFAVEEEPHKP